jgi:hypothetical protein
MHDTFKEPLALYFERHRKSGGAGEAIMKTKIASTTILSAVLAMALPVVGHAALAGEETYKQAYMTETVERDPSRAIELYKKVIAQSGDQSVVTAKAHLRLGICYEKMGRTSDARMSYQDVLDMTEAPQAVIQQARDHLQRLQPVAEKPAHKVDQTPMPAYGSSQESPKAFSRGRFEVSFQAGATLTNVNYGPFHFNFHPGVSHLYQVSGLYEITPWLSFGPEISYPFTHKVSEVYGSYNRTERKIFQFTPLFQIGPWIETGVGKIKPYLTVGGGLYRVTDNIRLLSYYWDPVLGFGAVVADGVETRNLGGFNGGFGCLFSIGDHLAVGPDLRYHHIFDSGETYYYYAAQARIALLF